MVWRLFRSLACRKLERVMTKKIYRCLKDSIIQIEPKNKKTSKKEKLKRPPPHEMVNKYLAPAEIKRITQRLKPKKDATSTPLCSEEDKTFYRLLGSFSMGNLPHEVQAPNNKIYLRRNNNRLSTSYQIKSYSDLQNAESSWEFFQTVHSNPKTLQKADMYYHYHINNLKPPMSEAQGKIWSISEKATLISHNRKTGRNNTTADEDEDNAAPGEENTGEESAGEDRNSVEDRNSGDNSNSGDDEAGNDGEDNSGGGDENEDGNGTPLQTPTVTPAVRKPRKLYQQPQQPPTSQNSSQSSDSDTNNVTNNVPKLDLFQHLRSSQKRKNNRKGKSRKKSKTLVSDSDDMDNQHLDLNDTEPMEDDASARITGTYLLNINYCLLLISFLVL